jgi:hypothetical protein
MRQQPIVALVTADGKEKTRKPIDPPPIVELTVDSRFDPQQQFLQSPYIWAAASLINAETHEAPAGGISKSLTGSLVSSLTRLKDTGNKDGGYFVFGDISVKLVGRFKLEFHLFELRDNVVVNIGRGRSAAFTVVTAKDFKGMAQSTQLSRSFSDQGARLRLRKEPRTTNKRGYSDATYESPEGSSRPGLLNEQSSSFDAESSPHKRFKTEADDRKDTFVEGTIASVSGYAPSFPSMPSYPSVQHAAHGQTIQSSPATYNGLPSSYTSLSGGVSSAYQTHAQVLNPAQLYSPQAYHANMTTSGMMPGLFSNPRGYAGMQTTYAQRTAAAPSAVDAYAFNVDYSTEHRYTPN